MEETDIFKIDDHWWRQQWFFLCTLFKKNKVNLFPADESAVTCHIEPQKMEARMDTAPVQAVIGLGYSRKLVREVIQKQLVETGKNQILISLLVTVKPRSH